MTVGWWPNRPDGALEELGFQYFTMLQQAVVGAVEGAQAHGFEVAAEQLAEGGRWRSQVQVASSEAGAAMRPTSRPSAAWRWGPDRPSSRSKSGRPSCSAAHRAACSTPTERGRASLSESTSTHWKSGCRESCGAGSGGGAGVWDPARDRRAEQRPAGGVRRCAGPRPRPRGRTRSAAVLRGGRESAGCGGRGCASGPAGWGNGCRG